MIVRPANEKDKNVILKMYAYSRDFMKKNGNPNQWGDIHPLESLIEEDIRLGRSFLCEENGEPVGVFALVIGEDPTYSVIENGSWIEDTPYGTIHRLASNGKAKGVAQKCFEYCREQISHLRVDTHEDNVIMQKVAEEFGFKHCGTIYVRDRSPRLAYEYVGKQYIHISFDDVYACLKDITDNSHTYVSIFENEFLAWLQKMNKVYGAVFTLYTFNYDDHAPDYDISNLPDKYSKELAQNAGWLKFAFHAKDNLKKYDGDDAEGIKADYAKFVAAILSASGNCPECIDRVSRLGFFAGSKENVEALQQGEYGLLGLLTADNSEERISYYFDEGRTKRLNRMGEYRDTDNGLLFLRSQLRLENVTSMEEQFRKIQSYKVPKVIELFTHEQCFYGPSPLECYTVQALLEKYIEWAYEQGYGFDYAVNHYLFTQNVKREK